MGPIRELGFDALRTVKPEDVRKLGIQVHDMIQVYLHFKIYIFKNSSKYLK